MIISKIGNMSEISKLIGGFKQLYCVNHRLETFLGMVELLNLEN